MTDHSPEPTDGPGSPAVADRLPAPTSPASVRDEAASGGLPEDESPSADDRAFVSADDAAATLAPGDSVCGVTADDTTEADPRPTLVLHEIRNDAVDSVPASVTYFPLTGRAMGFARSGFSPETTHA